jgi:hypothetical protein
MAQFRHHNFFLSFPYPIPTSADSTKVRREGKKKRKKKKRIEAKKRR